MLSAKSGGLLPRSVLLCLCFVSLVQDFNLDVRVPVVKQGSKHSYFGFSVALHQTLHDNGTVYKNWLLVGAPRDQNLQPNTNRSGALWRCPLTMKLDDCDQVVTDGRRDPYTGIYDDSLHAKQLLPASRTTEIKDDQWMGVTVRSQGPGKKVLVCAHRYVAKGPDYHWGRGLCYTLTQHLDAADIWEPCMNRKTSRGHEQWGFCQVGTSGFLMGNDFALLGTPGPYTWRGTVFAVNISDNFLERDKTFYHLPVSEGSSPVDKYSYLGFSVGGGHFFQDHVSYVAGAPRSNGTGKVIFFRKPISAFGGNSLLEVELVLKGEVFASSFGYELATVDFNSDGWSDLVVGAPFYYAKNKGGAIYVYLNDGGSIYHDAFVRVEGKPESRFGFAITNLKDLNRDGYEDIAVGAPYENQGVVYIFLGSSEGIISKPSQIIQASEMPKPIPKSFGYVLSGGMDMDGNGYFDLLIGAFASSKVFLIRARPIIGIVTTVEPIDNITNIDPSSRGFAFRACFRMNTTKPLNNLDMKYRIEAETFAKKKFSRVKFKDSLPERSSVVEKAIHLSNDNVLHFKCSREIVYVKDSVQDIQTPVEFKLTYSLIQDTPHYSLNWLDINDYPILNQQEAIKYFEAQFHKDCGDNDICESDLHLDVVLNLKLGDDEQPALQLGEENEMVLNITILNKGESAYMANLYVVHPESISFTGKLKSQEPSQFECSDVNRTFLKCHLGNPFKRGVGSLQLRFNPQGLTDLESHVEFRVFANTTSEEVNVQEPIVLVARVVKRAELSLLGQAQPDLVSYGGKLMGESAVKYLESIGSKVEHIYQVINRGPWRVTRLTVIINWPHEVENNNAHGKWLLYLTDFPHVVGGEKCDVPEDAVNVLNLTNQLGSSESEFEFFHDDPSQHDDLESTAHVGKPPKDVFPAYRKSKESNLTKSLYRESEDRILPYPNEFTNAQNDPSSHGKKMKKRETERIGVEELTMDKDEKKKKIITMFRCPIRNLLKDQSTYIRISARLWNSTLVEDYANVQRVEIQSRARIEIADRWLDQEDLTDDTATATTRAYPDPDLLRKETQKVPLWIIVASVVTGLVVLVILILILWKIGFFERRKKSMQNGSHRVKVFQNDSGPEKT